jgi:hypothetical protein
MSDYSLLCVYSIKLLSVAKTYDLNMYLFHCQIYYILTMMLEKQSSSVKAHLKLLEMVISTCFPNNRPNLSMITNFVSMSL